MGKKTMKTSIQRMEDKEVLNSNLQSMQGSQEFRPKRRVVKKKSMFEEETPNSLKEEIKKFKWSWKRL